MEFKERHNISLSEARIRLRQAGEKRSFAEAVTTNNISEEDLQSKINVAVEKAIGSALEKVTLALHALQVENRKLSSSLILLASKVGRIADTLVTTDLASQPNHTPSTRSTINPTPVIKSSESKKIITENKLEAKIGIKAKNTSQTEQSLNKKPKTSSHVSSNRPTPTPSDQNQNETMEFSNTPLESIPTLEIPGSQSLSMSN